METQDSKNLKLRNKFRGIIAKYRSNHVRLDPKITMESVLYSEINELFLLSQFQLNEIELNKFLNWVYLQIENLLPQLKNKDIKFDYFFRANTENSIPDLSRQIRFLVNRVNLEKDKINHFLILKNEFEKQILNKEYKKCLETLDTIELKFGSSFWSIQNRIYIIHNYEGLEAQKKYSNELRKKLTYGLIKYFIYNISIRNEDATSIKKFDDQLNKKIENIEDSAIKNYLTFRLTSNVEFNLDQIKEILFIEQNHSIIDQYETLIDLFQIIFKGSNSNYLEELNIEKLNTDDIRVEKLKKYIKNQGELTKNRTKPLYENANHMVDIYTLIHLSINIDNKNSNKSIIEELSNKLNSIIVRKKDNDKDLGSMLKICTNLNGLSIFKDLITLIKIIYTHDYLNKKNLINLSLNSPLYGFEESIYLEENSAQIKLLKDYFYKINLEEKHSTLKTITLIKNLLLSKEIGIERTVEIISNETIKGYSYTYILPVTYSLKDYSINSYREVNNKINLFITLYEYHSSIKSEKEQRRVSTLLKTLLREYFNDLKTTPSKLEIGNTNKEKYIYFMKYICSENFIDQLKSITSTKQVLEERIKIYQNIKEVDHLNENIYNEEIKHIAFKLASEEGQQLVDKTRIYVDEDHFKKWMNIELSESFNRYKDIKKVNIELPIDIDSIAESIKEKSDKLLILTTEDEVLLYNMIKVIKNEFLTNPSFGLDFYLSQRIRHQSFIGLIRGPLEHSNLITIKDSVSNKYEKNEYLLSKTENKSNESKKLNLALMNFSEKFDNILLSAKDDYFQILSPEKPKGLFKIDIDAALFEISKILINEAKCIDDFSDYILPLLWGVTEQSLQNVRFFISNYLKPNIENYFNELKNNLKKYLNEDSKYNILLELSNAINDVNKALTTSSNWFLHDIDILNNGNKTYFIKEAFNIAISLSLKCIKSFEPSFVLNIKDETTKLSSFSLINIHDLIFIILDNISKYSGKKRPEIIIDIDVDLDKLIIHTKVTSPVKTESIPHHTSNINKIKKIMNSGDITVKNKTENGSGLLKIASKVYQKENGYLDFNIIDKNFILEVAYSLKVNSMEA